MTDQHDITDQHANVSTDLTTLADAQARVRIDAAERDPTTVGSVLARYRAGAGLTEQQIAGWLGINLPVLADLAEEAQPGTDEQDFGLDQLAEVYGADRARLLEAFDQADAPTPRGRVQVSADDGRRQSGDGISPGIPCAGRAPGNPSPRSGDDAG